MSPATNGAHRYTIYGSCLESELSFPELRPEQEDPPRWRFSLDPSLPAEPDGPLLGEEHIYGAVHARLRRASDDGYWIHVPDTGTYHVSPDGSTIRWRPTDDPWWDFGRAHLMGRVLATSLHLDGFLTLHASAVAIDGGAVAFLAPKGAGKSTLAMALATAGCGLLTDDALPVLPHPGRAPVAHPGVHTLRLTPESRSRLGMATAGATTREGKVTVSDLPAALLACRPLPLRAVYVLAPLESDPASSAATRVELGKVRATLALRGQEKIGAMLGPSNAPALLDRASAVARRVPVYTLGLARDLDRLSEVVDTLIGWHAGAAPDAGH